MVFTCLLICYFIFNIIVNVIVCSLSSSFIMAAAAIGGGVGSQECSICMDDYNHRDKRPKALFCGHTFCAQCIQDITDARNRVGLLWLKRHEQIVLFIFCIG